MSFPKLLRKPAPWLLGVLIVFFCLAVWWVALMDLKRPFRIAPARDSVTPRPFNVPAQGTIRILSLDGGGVRGVITAELLAEIERQTGRSIYDLFDVFSGTSAGSIPITCILANHAEGKSISCAVLAETFEHHAHPVFREHWARNLFTLSGMLAPKLGSKTRQKAFLARIGSTLFGQLEKPLMLTSFDINSNQPVNLRSWDPEWAPYRAADLVVAATAVPVLFQPVLTPAPKIRALVDRGIYQNNPAGLILEEVVSAYPDRDIYLLSIGTGTVNTRMLSEGGEGWGGIGWIENIFPLITHATSQDTDDWIVRFRKFSAHRHKTIYYERLDPVLDHSISATFLPEHIPALRQSAKSYIQSHPDDFQRISGVLKAISLVSQGPSAPPSAP